MRKSFLISPVLLLLCACSFSNRVLGDDGESGDETGDGESEDEPGDGDGESGDGDGDGESGDGDGDGDGLPSGSCWTEQRTSYGYLHAVTVDAEHMLVLGDDGLWIEDQGSISLEPGLAALPAIGLTEQIIGTPDDLWVVDIANLWHWDGSTLTNRTDSVSEVVLRQTPAGELWRVGEEQGGFVLQSYDGQAWQDHPIPALDHVRQFAVGESSQWLLERDGLAPMRLASRVDGGEWLIEEVPLPIIGVSEPGLGIGDSGGVFVVAPMITCAASVVLAYREPDGTWHTDELSLDFSPTNCVVEVHMVGDIAYLRPHRSGIVWRWDGSSPPEMVGSSGGLPFGSGGGRIVAFDDMRSLAFYELEFETGDFELLEELPTFEGGPSSGVSLDAMFTGAGDQLQRWSGTAWTGLAPALHDGHNLAAFLDVSADSPTSAWAVAITGDLTQLWRWQDGELTAWDELGPSAQLVWARSETEVWAPAIDLEGPSALVMLGFDGQTWAPLVELDESVLAMTGDADTIYFSDVNRQVWAYDGGVTLTPLGDPLTVEGASEDALSVSSELAVLGANGELLLARFRWTDVGPQEELDVSMVWDGVQWSTLAERWPEGPAGIAKLAEDRTGGVFVVSDDPTPELWYGDGIGWTQLGHPEGALDGYLAAAPEGLFVVDSRTAGQRTREFRWSCP